MVGAIVGLERLGQGARALELVPVAVGVGPALEQGADEALGLAIGLRPVGPRLADGDPALGTASGPAALEAAAVFRG